MTYVLLMQVFNALKELINNLLKLLLGVNLDFLKTQYIQVLHHNVAKLFSHVNVEGLVFDYIRMFQGSNGQKVVF